MAVMVPPATRPSATSAEVCRLGGRETLEDVTDLGIVIASTDDDEAQRLAELWVVTGLKLPNCRFLDLSGRQNAVLATSTSGWRPPRNEAG